MATSFPSSSPCTTSLLLSLHLPALDIFVNWVTQHVAFGVGQLSFTVMFSRPVVIFNPSRTVQVGSDARPEARGSRGSS